VRIQGRIVRRALAVLAVATGLALVSTATPAAANEDGVVGPRIFATILRGANEVPNAADPNGIAIAIVLVIPQRSEVCYLIKQENFQGTIVAAHIHKAPRGSNGPVVVPLAAPTDGLSKGCVTVAQALAQDIAANPRGYYVNIHSTVFPAGAARGQLP
jgi:CHRD domain-containing protein